jgi:hypothetical protein
MTSSGSKLNGPFKIGLVFGSLGALLTIIGIVFGDFAPLTLRTLLLGILLGGGSWGLVSWAIASAAVDATEPEVIDGAGPAGTDPHPAAIESTSHSDQEHS